MIHRGSHQTISKQDLYRYILALFITFLIYVPNVSLVLISSNVNKPQAYIIPVKSQQSRPLADHSLTFNQNNLISPISFSSRDNIDPIEMNIYYGDEAFNGYNLFVLEQRNRTDDNDKRATLFITDMNGDVIIEKEIQRGSYRLADYSVEFINSTTILMRIGNNPTLWNYYTNISQTLDIDLSGCHHDFEYNPITNTILVMKKIYSLVNETNYRFDEIIEYNASGGNIWSLDTRSFVSPNHWCPYHDKLGKTADVTHSNSLFWDVDEDIIILNLRNSNTFYKIDHKTGKMIWGLGEYGNFSLFDKYGNQKSNLFYHAHSVEQVDNNTFILFDNDYHNQINVNNHRSRIIEIEINETTMTANETWSWTAPPDYYSSIWSDADRLPNGNRLGTFGTLTHPDTNIGARFVEVNDDGEIVWEMKFENTEEFNYGAYRMERFRFSPIFTEFEDILISENENLTISWQTWYNFRSKRNMTGSYTLFLDNEQIKSGNHTFDKFWRPTNLTFELKQLTIGNHNLTLMLEDEGGHYATNNINIKVGVQNTSQNNLVEILLLSFGLICLVVSILLILKSHRK